MASVTKASPGTCTARIYPSRAPGSYHCGAGTRTSKAPGTTVTVSDAPGRDHLAVDLAGQFPRGVDLHAAGLVPFQRAAITTARGQDAVGHPRPAERRRGREDAHVEQAVVQAGPGQQPEPAGQQAGVADHDRPGPPGQRRRAVEPYLERGAAAEDLRGPGRRVGEPAGPAFSRPGVAPTTAASTPIPAIAA